MPGPNRHLSSSSNASHRPRPSELRRWRQHLAKRAAPKPPFTAIWRNAAPARSATSCWRWPPPRAVTSSFGWPCSTRMSASRGAAISVRGCWVFWPATSDRCSCWHWLSAPRHGRRYDADVDATATDGRRRTHPRRGGPRRWRPSGRTTGCPGVSAPRCSGPTTDLSAISPWCWVSVPAECPTTRYWSPGWPDCWPARLSMGAGEYVSVRSQRELLEASTPGSARPIVRCRSWMSTPTSWPWFIGRAA